MGYFIQLLDGCFHQESEPLNFFSWQFLTMYHNIAKNLSWGGEERGPFMIKRVTRFVAYFNK